ncbi:MAG: hypothetical protein RI885_1116 [Actinomycetota bacterium]|jgi:glycosyltransferase involved in cell wall biosynthesis
MAGVLIHEWIAKAGGSENVLEAMSRVYPDADILCLWNDSVGRFDGRSVRESWLAKTPLRRSKALALPFMPAVWRGLRNRDYDWALISSHLFAHHARFRAEPAGFKRFVYVHTPARYIWSPELDRRGDSPAVRAVSSGLKPLDRRRASEGAVFAANSRFVRDRIAAAWESDARVINPPVEVESIQSVADWRERLSAEELATLEALPEAFILGASRFIPYKRLDLVIRTGELADLPVVLAGAGPEAESLAARAERASVPVHFVDAPSGAMLYALYQRALLYVFPAVEDFGIMPVEAMAAGAPVLAQAIGGTAESVVAGVTGALVDFESDHDIRTAVGTAIATGREARLVRARDFSVARFDREIADWVAGRS